MARIRTIKPEFWSNEALSTCHETTRLLAIALLNFADDDGWFKAHPNLIKSFAFPYNEPSIPVTKMLEELCQIKFIEIYIDESGVRYGVMPTFREHQVINKYKPSKIKAFKLTPVELPYEYRTALVSLPPGMEQGMEPGMDLMHKQEVYAFVNGKPSTPVDNFFLEKEKKGKILTDCPYAQILSEFEKILPELPQPVTLSDGRKKHVLARWKENPEIGYFLQVFHGVQQSDFLMGRRLDKNQRSWRASFDWIMTARNWEKIVDGNYDNK